MSQIINLSRRGFLKAGIAGGGLVLGLYLPAVRLRRNEHSSKPRGSTKPRMP